MQAELEAGLVLGMNEKKAKKLKQLQGEEEEEGARS